MQKFYVDQNGNYIGSFVGPVVDDVWRGPEIPDGAVEVSAPPDNAGQIWDNGWKLDKESLMNGLESVRYEVEQGGITVSGLSIPTRDRDKTLINGKISAILIEQRPDNETFNFVLSGENITMTNAQIKAIGLAIEAHVQGTIDVAGYIRSLIMAGELTTQEEVRAAYLAEFS